MNLLEMHIRLPNDEFAKSFGPVLYIDKFHPQETIYRFI